MFSKKKSFHLTSSNNEEDIRLLKNILPTEVKQKALEEYDLLIFADGGITELELALLASSKGYKVCLLEPHALAHKYLLSGELPAKIILEASKTNTEIENPLLVALDRVKRVRADISSDYSHQRLLQNGIDVFFGKFNFLNENTIKCGKNEISFKKAFFKTPFINKNFQINGIENETLLSSVSLYDLDKLPQSLLIIGSSNNSLEISEAFSKLGTQVTILESEANILPNFTSKTSRQVEIGIKNSGVSLLKNCTVFSAEKGSKKDDFKYKVYFSVGDEPETSIETQHILCLTGNKLKDLSEFELNKAEIKYNSDGVIADSNLKTTNDNIFSAGETSLSIAFDRSPKVLANLIYENILKGKKNIISSHIIPEIVSTESPAARIGEFKNQDNQLLSHFSETINGKIYSSINAFALLETSENGRKIEAAEVFGKDSEEIVNVVSFFIKENLNLGLLKNFSSSSTNKYEIFEKLIEKSPVTPAVDFKDNLLKKFKLF